MTRCPGAWCSEKQIYGCVLDTVKCEVNCALCTVKCTVYCALYCEVYWVEKTVSVLVLFHSAVEFTMLPVYCDIGIRDLSEGKADLPF